MDFYFSRKGFNKKIKLLTYLVNTTSYLLLITGPRKVGKTAFLEHWLTNKEHVDYNDLDNIRVSKIALNYGDKIDLEVIKEQCIANWQLNINENFVISFKDVIANIPEDTMYQYLLVIDNAERLPKDILQELIKLNAETNSLVFRLVLIGNNILSGHITSVTRNKNYKSYNLKIAPLSLKETKLFLMEFYRNHNKTVPFNYRQVVNIHKKSSGIILNIIREIRNYHAPQVKIKVKSNNKFDFINHFIKIKDKISLNFISEYSEVLRNISIASLGMIILGLFIFQEEINNKLDHELNFTQENLQVAVNAIPEIKSEIQSNKIKSVELEQTETKKSEVQVDKSEPKITPLKVTKKVKKIKKVQKFKNSKDAPHVLALNDDNYTIQLGAYLKKQEAVDFINKNIKNHNAREDFKVVAAKRNNNIYYLVLYGNFETNKLANNYVKIMKQSLKRNGAWIRQIASVKHDIKNIS